MVGMPLSRSAGVAALVLVLSISGCTQDQRTTPVASNAPIPTFDNAQLSMRFAACTDLNGFVNAKWAEDATIPADKSSYGSFDMLADESRKVQREIVEGAVSGLGTADHESVNYQVGLLYRAATDDAKLDAAGYDPIRPTLAAIDQIASPEELAAFLAADSATGQHLVFDFTAGADYANATEQIGYARADALGMPAKDYYTDPKYAPVFDAYRAYIASTFGLIGADQVAAKARAEQVAALESALAAATLSPVQQRDPANQYKLVTVAQANAVTPHFEWGAYLKAHGAPEARAFSLAETEFFTTFDRLLSTTDLDTWKSYLTFHAVHRSADALSKAFRDNAFKYKSALTGTTAQKQRWEQGLEEVNTLVGPALGQLYVDRMFSDRAKRAATEMVGNVKEALRKRIEAVDWMSPQTKLAAKGKWDKLILKVGFPGKERDFSKLKLTGDNFYTDRAAALKFNHDFDMAKIGHPTDRSLWGMTPQTVNAQYDPTENSITIPAAILQAPFYDPKGDPAFNYGGIGAVIGHEFTHAFDDEGSQFDGEGNRVNWWTPNDREEFEKRANRLVEQFNAYAPIPGRPDLHVDGKLTLGENIADLGGVNTAYDALVAELAKKGGGGKINGIVGFNDTQRFFLNYARIWRDKQRPEAAITQLAADPHSPPALRINGVVPNVAPFAADFGCLAGDPMVNPPDKFVKIW
ncbi:MULTISPECIES: M13 family metallopeptidase [Mycobacteroides]|uniref:Peptidase n=1 Tax=Mycobacteroides chelonae TaxID=1774 RepID=A0A1S1LRL9_MYCCH|nr:MULTISPECIES: M13 family metallopeptidase [Mycobacteroides]KRQ19463.1 peptidase [Mycobacteroides sp. H003]KRQ21936.1 peptidase [Mycobacteroides sp. H092]KRQ46133.1 peptidase [Mycobacteroides sp. H101]KRQ49689.1 peptidase [Mycobacteroides sp. H063]KRQ52332.1 peptidase [Mycobacteroides sp. HXVII]